MTVTTLSGRSLAEFLPLSAAEQRLKEACRDGTVASLGSERPKAATSENRVRAALVAFLALGGDQGTAPHRNGVRLEGGWIEGALDLHAGEIARPLVLDHCHLDTKPNMRYAAFAQNLMLEDCWMPGAEMDGMSVRADLFLRQIQSTGEISLLGAHIGADLVFDGATLRGQGEDALSMDLAVVKGAVLFNDGFSAVGEVRLLDVQVSGNVECKGAQFDGARKDALSMDRAVVHGSVFFINGFTSRGRVRLLNARLGAFCCENAEFDPEQGINAEGANIEGSWFLRQLKTPLRHARLSGMRVRALIDDDRSWGTGLVLDGFEYGSLAGSTSTDAVSRIAWLKQQQPELLGTARGKQSFRPQPWLRLQKVFREMGHFEDARQVAIALENHRRTHGLVGQTPVAWGSFHRGVYVGVARTLHAAFGWLMGYGHRPSRLLGWMVGVWLGCAAIYWAAALQGVFAPTQPLIFNDARFVSCRSNWYLCTELPEEYAGFSPVAYSLDVLLPVVNLQQETEWAPLIPTPKAPWWSEWLGHWSLKHVTRLVVWFEILFGWVASLLMVAVVSGLTKRREE